MKREPRMALWLMNRLGVAVPADGQRRSFWRNALFYGAEFALVFGALRCVLDMVWRVPVDAGDIGWNMAFGGAFFGGLMAWIRSRAR